MVANSGIVSESDAPDCPPPDCLAPDCPGPDCPTPDSPVPEAGARCRLGEVCLEVVLADFEAHGAEAIAKIRTEKPDQYFKVVATFLPKEIGGEGDSESAGGGGPRVVERRIVHVGN